MLYMIQNKSKTRLSPNSLLVQFCKIVLPYHQSSHIEEWLSFSKSIRFTLETADTMSFLQSWRQQTKETCQLRRTAHYHTDTHEKSVDVELHYTELLKKKLLTFQ